jgi:hypothetical protein
MLMTRSDAMARIHAALASLDDEALQAVATIVDVLATAPSLPQPSMAGRKQASAHTLNDDPPSSRPYALDEARALAHAYLAQRRSERGKA